MTIVSNDSTWWPSIDAYRFSSYFSVAAFVGVTYDWVSSALTFEQEVELVWVRYLGICFAALDMLDDAPSISLTDTGCLVVYIVQSWTCVVVFAMIWVVMITRLYAMYQGSRKILIFLIITFLVVNIFDGVAAIIATARVSGEELILSGTYECSIVHAEDISLLSSISWLLGTGWEVLALCLAVWIAIIHFRELRRHSGGGFIIKDYFMVLMKTHVLYFAAVGRGSFVTVSRFELTNDFSPKDPTVQNPLKYYSGLIQIFGVMPMLVLAPRLILSVRDHHAKLVADSHAASDMISIVFQERMHISTGSRV
ncbi:uncharacterized protein EDB93DRAFT_1106158 [Suillus bovinus]|uniref:uncharacterized protein n=1 Tax=Suillus bovinus TaxID=48563 RepID=UPI001B87DB60|nr:uncharacterized protein EDB93DRAFT_1106158 [Suillus bovinus]KAG2139183.1 hypothetical protein EDB93DRAFT_1106158 [Suillus bovinus]